VRYRIAPPGAAERATPLEGQIVADLAASFQEAVVDCLVAKTMLAARRTGMRVLCVGGGVAANGRFRARLLEETERGKMELHIPPLRLCTDNAVMGAIAVERLNAGLVEPLDLDVYPGLVR
jgi:N6-L-threonylcarbamoyladenine synthase